VGLERGIGFGEEIRVSVDAEVCGVEYLGPQVHVRGIDARARPDVADVARTEVDGGEVHRFHRSGLDVREVAVDDAQEVDLERVDGKSRLLPAALLHRRLVLRFLLRVAEVDVEGGAVEAEVGDQRAVQQRDQLTLACSSGTSATAGPDSPPG